MNFLKKTSIFSLILAFAIMSLSLVFVFGTGKGVQLKGMVVGFVKKTKKIIYHEATIFNPKGDVLPDQVDDIIISKTKKILN
ncbi:MAG: hypothetical protein ACD_9C00291G0002 [uncultured bacterium]|nr:MAG: hypothetical protein ACD_9C00291G0002 [uncultured bacterium]